MWTLEHAESLLARWITKEEEMMLVDPMAEAIRVATVLMQLIACFVIGSIAIAIWTGDDDDSWQSSAAKLIKRSIAWMAMQAEEGQDPGQSRLAAAATQVLTAQKSAAPSKFADVAKEAMGAHQALTPQQTSRGASSSSTQAPMPQAPTPQQSSRGAKTSSTQLRKLGAKSIANINLGNLGDLQAKRRQEIFASIFERHFGLEVLVVAALALAHWMHGRGLFDWLFLLLWTVAALALFATRAGRLLLYAKARKVLAKVERATMRAEGELPARLRDGTVRLVNVRWLLAHAGTLSGSEGIACHQDLPPEAFLPPAEAHTLLENGVGGSVAALSYGWLSAAHPDPYAFHLRAVTSWLSKHPTVEAIFWDWLSLPQKRPKVGRTAEEQQRFLLSLEVMLHLYASPRVVVMQHKNMPIRPDLNTRPYEKRGWCLVEQYTAFSVNVRDKVADIARGYFVPADGNRIDPEELAELLSKAHFTGKADRELVLMLYESFHRTALELDMALVDAGLGEVQSKPGKKSKPGVSTIRQAAKDLNSALRGKIGLLIAGADSERPSNPAASERRSMV